MTRRSLICVLLAAVLLFGSAGCSAEHDGLVGETQAEQTGEDTMQTNEQLLIRKLGLSEDRAKGACEKLQEAGVPRLKKAGWVSKQKDALASVTDENGETYLLAFGGLGFLESIVRESDDRYLYFQTE